MSSMKWFHTVYDMLNIDRIFFRLIPNKFASIRKTIKVRVPKSNPNCLSSPNDRNYIIFHLEHTAITSKWNDISHYKWLFTVGMQIVKIFIDVKYAVHGGCSPMHDGAIGRGEWDRVAVICTLIDLIVDVLSANTTTLFVYRLCDSKHNIMSFVRVVNKRMQHWN